MIAILLSTPRRFRAGLCSALFFLASLLSAPLNAVATPSDSHAPSIHPTPPPEAVAVGFYLNRISELSQKDGMFDIDAWFWFRWKNGSIDPTKTFEIVNGRIESSVPTEVLNDQGFKYTQIRVHAKIFHVFDVHRYPLDDHALPIIVEDSTSQASLLQLHPDEGSMVDPSVSVEGWTVDFRGVKAADHVYPTTYGYRSLGEKGSDFSRLTFTVGLARQNTFLSLMKLFWVSILALLLSIGACFVRSNDLDARFGLGLGSIFAASANTIAVSANLPDTPLLTLAEQINMLTVLYIFISIFISIISLRLRYADRPEAAERLDFASAFVLSLFYAITLAGVFWWA